MVENTTWDELVDLTKIVTPEVNQYVNKWGINVEMVSFPDLGNITTYRIITDGGVKDHTFPVPTGNQTPS
jgi:hypothetical protein